MDIPKLKFPRDEIIEIIPAAYQNEAKRVHIPGLDPKTIPGSPEDIRIPVPDTGIQLPPIPGMNNSESAPAATARPPEKIVNNAKEMVSDRVADED